MSEICNACCPLFQVLPCADTGAHQHLGCAFKSEQKKMPFITNIYSRRYCIGDDSFKDCPYYQIWLREAK